MKNLFLKIAITGVGLFLFPLMVFGLELNESARVDTSQFILRKPTGVDKWYTRQDFTEGTDNGTVEAALGTGVDDGIMHITYVEATDQELVGLQLFPDLIFELLHCEETMTTPIDGYTFESFNCFVKEEGSGALKESSVSFGLVGNFYYIILEDYGKNSQDKSQIIDLRNNISFPGRPVTTNSNNLLEINSNPALNMHLDNQWFVYDYNMIGEENASSAGYSIVGGLKSLPFHNFYILYSTGDTSDLANMTNQEIYEQIILPEYQSPNNLASYNFLDVDYDYDVNDSLTDTLMWKVEGQQTEIYHSHQEIKEYAVGFAKGSLDQNNYIMFSYVFFDDNREDAYEKMDQFEREVAQKATLMYFDEATDQTNEDQMVYDFNTYEDLQVPTNGLDGELITPVSSQAVYLVKPDGKRYVFPNERVYASWYDNFNTVREVSDETLAQYQIGGNINMKPGSLIKITTIPKVYVVLEGNKIAWVETEEAARRLFGTDWNKKITDVPDSLFVNYKEVGYSIK